LSRKLGLIAEAVIKAGDGIAVFYEKQHVNEARLVPHFPSAPVKPDDERAGGFAGGNIQIKFEVPVVFTAYVNDVALYSSPDWELRNYSFFGVGSGDDGENNQRDDSNAQF